MAPIDAPVDLYIDGCHACRIDLRWVYDPSANQYDACQRAKGMLGERWERAGATLGGEDAWELEPGVPFQDFLLAYLDARGDDSVMEVQLMVDGGLQVEMDSACMETAGTAYFLASIGFESFARHRAQKESQEIEASLTRAERPTSLGAPRL